MIRAYFSTFAGTGAITNPFRTVLLSLLPNQPNRFVWFVDGRPNQALLAGQAFVVVDVSNAEHGTLIANAGVTYLPFEATGSVPLELDAQLSQVTLANRTTIRNHLATRHIPDDGIQLTDSLRETLRRVARRFLLRTILGPDDFTEGLDTLVSAVPVVRRQAIRTRLVAMGIDFDGILGSDTIRIAIRKIVTQNARVFRIRAV